MFSVLRRFRFRSDRSRPFDRIDNRHSDAQRVVPVAWRICLSVVGTFDKSDERISR